MRFLHHIFGQRVVDGTNEVPLLSPELSQMSLSGLSAPLLEARREAGVADTGPLQGFARILLPPAVGGPVLLPEVYAQDSL
jgi:hypothetical protein